MAKRTRVTFVARPSGKKVSFLSSGSYKKKDTKKRTDWKGMYEDAEEKHINEWNRMSEEVKANSDDWSALAEKQSGFIKRQRVAIVVALVSLLLVWLALFLVLDSLQGARSDLAGCGEDVGLMNDWLRDDRLLIDSCVGQLRIMTAKYEAKEIEILQSDYPPQLIFGCNDSGVVGVN